MRSVSNIIWNTICFLGQLSDGDRNREFLIVISILSIYVERFGHFAIFDSDITVLANILKKIIFDSR